MFHEARPRDKAITGHLSARKHNETKKTHVLKQSEFLRFVAGTDLTAGVQF